MRVVFVLVCLLVGANAHAQPADNEALALALFAEGRQLAAQADYVNACQKYEAAHGLEPWLGIELNLADCDEHVGKTATAWVLFRKAGDEAAKVGDPRAAYAHERAERLEPMLAHITIAPRDGVQLRFDGKPLPPAGLGEPLPVDPGDHVIAADAPGHNAWSQVVTVAAGASVDVAVPALEADQAAAAAAPMPARSRRTRSRLALSLGGAGAAAIGASLLLGLDAKLRYDDAQGCDAQLVCGPQGYAAIREARSRGDLATIVGGAGVAAFAGAVFIYLRAPVTPMAAPSTLGISVQGAL